MTTETDLQEAQRAWDAVTVAEAGRESAAERLHRTRQLLKMGAADEAEVNEAEAAYQAAYEGLRMATNAAELRSRMAAEATAE